ncbi:hypothetical protein AKJ16_DCAP06740 [Drosera capensis]
MAAVAPLSRFFHRKPNPSNTRCRRRRQFQQKTMFVPIFRCAATNLLSQLPRRSFSQVCGAGFAGLSVAWHLLRQSPMELNVHTDMFDDAGIGGGASGVAGGLVHPYFPKDSNLPLLNLRQRMIQTHAPLLLKRLGFIIRRRGILRPATSEKNLAVMLENAQKSLESCRIETIDKSAAQHLLPEVCAPLNVAFFMPEAMNINPQFYLEALFLACQNFVPGEYDAVIICLGAGVNMLPQLAGKLPLRICRGIVAALRLPDGIGAEYPAHSPVILSDAWLVVAVTAELLGKLTAQAVISCNEDLIPPELISWKKAKK